MKDFKCTLVDNTILDLSDIKIFKTLNINVDLSYKILTLTSKNKLIELNTDEDSINIRSHGFGKIVIENCLFRNNNVTSNSVLKVEKSRNSYLVIRNNKFNGNNLGSKVINIDSPINVLIENNDIANFTQSYNTAITVNTYDKDLIIMNNTFFFIRNGIEDRVFNFKDTEKITCIKNLMISCGSEYSNKNNNAVYKDNLFMENNYSYLFDNYNVESLDFLKSEKIKVGNLKQSNYFVLGG